MTLIKKHYRDKIKFVKFKTTDGPEVSHKIYSFETKLNAGDVPIKLVVILGKWNSALFHGLSPAGSNKACPRENEDAYLTKILETKPKTFNGIKQAINAMLEFTSTKALSKNEQLAHGYFKIKSK